MKKDKKVNLKTSKTSLNEKPGKFNGFNDGKNEYGYNLETENQGILDTEQSRNTDFSLQVGTLNTIGRDGNRLH